MKYCTAIWIVIFLFSLFLPFLSNAQRMEVKGVSRETLDNKKDIYHKKNTWVRQKMIKDAVFDAIDKGARKTVSSEISHLEYSFSYDQAYEEYVDDFVSSSKTKTNVEWQRTSDYKFFLEDKKNKLWRCEVTGLVTNLKNGGGGVAPAPKKKNKYYVTRKSFNIVYLTAGTEDNVSVGDMFLIYKNKEKRSIAGSILKRKVVGYVTVTDVANSYCEGRIFKGMYGVRESHIAKKYNFKKSRTGIEYQLATSYEQVNTTEFGETESNVNAMTHSLYYYYFSYISRMGFKLGLEMMDVKKTYPVTAQNPYETDSSAYIFNPKFNLNYSIGLIPDILFIVPNASIGYLFFENGKQEIFDRVGKAWDADVVLEAGISAHLRIRSFDIVGGITFKYVNDYPELKNYYPHVGIAYNFVRYAKKGLAGEE